MMHQPLIGATNTRESNWIAKVSYFTVYDNIRITHFSPFLFNRVWGMIMDGESLAVIARIYDLPATNQGGMTFLDENIKFTMSLDLA